MTDDRTPVVDPKLAEIMRLQGLVAKLEVALYSPFSRASFEGRSVDYTSTDDIRQRLSLAREALRKLLDPRFKGTPQCGHATFNKGYATNNWGYGCRR